MELAGKFKSYWPFSKGAIQRMLSYRLNFFAFAVGGLIRTFSVYYLWKAVFYSSGQDVLNGFTMEQMLIYILMSEVTSRLVSSDVDSIIGEEVKEGSIAMNLIKPVNYQLRLLFRNLGRSVHQLLAIGLPLWIGIEIFRYCSLEVSYPGLGSFFIYLFSVLLSFIILFLFTFCFGILAFFVTNIWGLRMLKTMIISFCSGRMIPIVFFPDWAQKILNFLPFTSMNYTPVMIYLNKIEGRELVTAVGIQILWVGILLLITRAVWQKAVDRLTILGG